jgi:hypothetical protein
MTTSSTYPGCADTLAFPVPVITEYSGSSYTTNPVVGNRNSGKMETMIPVAETARQISIYNVFMHLSV